MSDERDRRDRRDSRDDDCTRVRPEAMANPAEDLACDEVVALVTAYLEGVMPPPDRAAFEEHLRACPGCDVHLEQIRTTIRASGRVGCDDLTPAAREKLLAAFRTWRDRKPG